MAQPGSASDVALSHVIDYAGMYPPESLGLEDALTSYLRHRQGRHQWMLGVFLCPSSKLHDLEWMLGGEPVPVGVVIDQHTSEAIEAIWISGVEIRQLETRDTSIAGHFDRIHAARALWLEADAKVVLDLAAEAPGRQIGVKLRCGGARQSDFPSPQTLAEAMHATFTCGLPLKATAGLHHPWRHFWPELGVWRHGFLNLIAAATALVLNGDRDDATEMLECTEGRLGRSGLLVGDREFTVSELRSARTFLRSYGSCSFEEPVDDLTAMGSLW